MSAGGRWGGRWGGPELASHAYVSTFMPNLLHMNLHPPHDAFYVTLCPPPT